MARSRIALFPWLWLAAVIHSGGCETHGATPPNPDGGPPLVLDVLDPPGTQIGLHYNKSVELRVGYHVDDAKATPVTGQPVRFSIFGDPQGSTLSADRDNTDDTGVATVRLTAGANEATFRVTASAVNAPDAEFQIAVSKLDFVELKVELAWNAPDPITLRALLYADTPCAQLPAAPSMPSPLRQGAKPGPSGTVDFINLLSMNYSVVGRAEDASGHLLAQSCVELPSALVPAGSDSTLPLPLSEVVADASGSYSLSTTLTISSAASGAATQPWHALTDCPLGPAQAILDGTTGVLGPSALTTAIDGLRGAPTGGCRPAMSAGKSTLDNDLEGLLTADPQAPANALAGMVSDLDALTQVALLDSHLTLTTVEGGPLSGEHTLDTLVLGAAGGTQASIDLAASGLPIVDVKDVTVSYDQGHLAIGQHGFTLPLPTLWQETFAANSIQSRFPALMPPSTRGFLGLLASAVVHGGMSGCSGVEDLVCTRTAAPSCTGNVAPACLTALDQLATTLDAGFAATPGVDFLLSGQCNAVDSNQDLSIDQLTAGTWTTTIATTATFTGTRP